MHHQKDRLRRDMLNNPRIYQSVLEMVEAGMAPCVRVSDRHNAIYGTGDVNECIVRASLCNGQVAGCTRSARSGAGPGARRLPSREWMRRVASGSDAAGIRESLEGMVAGQLDTLYGAGILKRGRKLDVAIDMHLIPRYDREPGEELVRARARGQTGSFGRYVTMQCLVPSGRLVLAVLRMPTLEDTVDFVRKTVDSARRAGSRLGTVLPDREFFSTWVIAALDGAGVSASCRAGTREAPSGPSASLRRGGAAGSRGPSCPGRAGTCRTPRP